MAGTFAVKDLQGNAPGTSPYVVNQSGTSQVLRISLEGAVFGVGEDVTVPLAVSGTGDATVSASALPLVFNSASQEHLVTVKGAADVGDFNLLIGASSSTDLGSDLHAIAQINVAFTNHSNQALAGNTAPTEPTLQIPAANATQSAAAAATFEWQHAYDRDGDVLSYSLCFSSNADMTGMQCANVSASSVVPGSGVAGFASFSPTSVVSMFLLSSVVLVVLWRRFRSPRISVVRRVTFMSTFFVLAGLGLSACGNQDLLVALRVPPRPTVRAVIEGDTLLSAGDVYWRVYADDSKGNLTPSSETRKLTVQP